MTICPACGVAVVPGYARCPKCHAALPRRLATNVEGGTAVPETRRRGPLVGILAAGVVGLGLILWLGLRHGHTEKPIVKPAVAPAQPTTVAATRPALASGAPDTASTPKGPPPETIAADLSRTLDKQRLWSTVTVTGSRVDVRSASCSDAAMQAPIAAAAPSFKAAGLTTLRCVEQSGAVVFSREL
jgi:hypothetical protein